jgi:hypothetical protein
VVNDTYSYGGPAKGRRPSVRLDPVKLGVVALVVAVVLVGGYAIFSVLRDGGETAAGSTRRAVGQIDVARDAEAQVTLSRVAMVAQTLVAQAGTGTTEVASADALAEMEPAFTYTSEPSTGPEVVSVHASADAWSAAVLSPSGACLWVRVDAAGVQTFGSGTPCTGTAAAAADAPSW